MPFDQAIGVTHDRRPDRDPEIPEPDPLNFVVINQEDAGLKTQGGPKAALCNFCYECPYLFLLLRQDEEGVFLRPVQDRISCSWEEIPSSKGLVRGKI